MIKISQIKCRPDQSMADLYQLAAKVIRIKSTEITDLKILKKSIDARKKPEIFLIYTVAVSTVSEEKILKKCSANPQVSLYKPLTYSFVPSGTRPLGTRPVIIGMGPAGLFCAYMLAKHGYRPLILERGEDVDQRLETVLKFWETGELNPESNVSFGEGGAGTFSDGKLNTLINDKTGRNQEVLRILVENGAKENILYEQLPHIGTDILIDVVRNMRKQIISWGGEVRFNTRVESLCFAKDSSLLITTNQHEKIEALLVVLAIGHSARDTFQMLYESGIEMEQKPFAVGLRVEHSQSFINTSQYASPLPTSLAAAPYKLAAKAKDGRGVYTFCMCPGGYVVNASTEDGMLAINGMSYSNRNGKNANSAVIITVTQEDFEDSHPLSGIAFQRNLEKKAYLLGKGKIPAETYQEFKENKLDENTENIFTSLSPQTKGAFHHAHVRDILPKELALAFLEGMERFDHMIPGFAGNDVVVTGVESRTSSPVRILRNELLTCRNGYLYPCGEGAGYAGGITSAAMDGIRVAEEIAKEFSKTIDETLKFL